ncbi:MAG TPA: hypothetical protein VLB82_14275 [Thermodesulfobacteriota bacterium]|nr:hypothetical protein [Thermodesulfobacteriota bacterium]
MLKIYGSEISNNVNKVRFLANAMGLEYELVHVDLLHGEQREGGVFKSKPGRQGARDGR